MDLLLGQHAGEDLAPVDDPLKELRVPRHDRVEGGAVACKHIVLARHVLDLAHVLATGI